MSKKTNPVYWLAVLAALGALYACSSSGNPSRSPSGSTPAAVGKKDARIPDLELRLDLLRRPIRRVQVGRNIFEYQVRAAPPSPPVVAPPPPAPGPVAASAPPAPLRFYGFAEGGSGGPRRVFLTDGEEIFIASEGDTLLRRYRVVRVGATSLELEDVVGGRRWVVPLEQP